MRDWFSLSWEGSLGLYRSRFKILEKNGDPAYERRKQVLTQIHLLLWKIILDALNRAGGHAPPHPICYKHLRQNRKCLLSPEGHLWFPALSALLGRASQLLLITQVTLVSWPQLSEGQRQPALASASHRSEDPAVLSAEPSSCLARHWCSWLPSHVLADLCSGAVLRVSGWWVTHMTFHGDPAISGPIKCKFILVPVTKVGQGRLKIAVVASVTVGVWLGTVFLLLYLWSTLQCFPKVSMVWIVYHESGRVGVNPGRQRHCLVVPRWVLGTWLGRVCRYHSHLRGEELSQDLEMGLLAHTLGKACHALLFLLFSNEVLHFYHVTISCEDEWDVADKLHHLGRM